MNLSEKTIDRIHQLTQNDKFGYVFDRMATRHSDAPHEVLRGLAEAFADEFDISTDDQLEKLIFLMQVATLACKEEQK